MSEQYINTANQSLGLESSFLQRAFFELQTDYCGETYANLMWLFNAALWFVRNFGVAILMIIATSIPVASNSLFGDQLKRPPVDGLVTMHYHVAMCPTLHPK